MNELLSFSNIKSYFLQESDKKLEEKQENELTLEDRLYYLNQNNDNSNDIINEILNIIKNSDIIDINSRVYEDLEFFNNYKNDKNHNTIYSKINNTKTTMGNLHLKQIIQTPINNTELLKDRQLVLKQYNNINDKDKKEINLALDKIHSIEKDLTWFWDINVQKHLYVLYDIVYLNLTGINKIDTYLNKNTTLLYLFNMYRIFVSPFVNMLSPLTTIIVPLLCFYYLKNIYHLKYLINNFLHLYLIMYLILIFYQYL